MYIYVIHLTKNMLRELEAGVISSKALKFLESAKLAVRFSVKYITRGTMGQLMFTGFRSNSHANRVMYGLLKEEFYLSGDVREFLCFPEDLLWKQIVDDMILISDTEQVNSLLREFSVFAVNEFPVAEDSIPGVYRIFCEPKKDALSIQAVRLTD